MESFGKLQTAIHLPFWIAWATVLLLSGFLQNKRPNWLLFHASVNGKKSFCKALFTFCKNQGWDPRNITKDVFSLILATLTSSMTTVQLNVIDIWIQWCVFYVCVMESKFPSSHCTLFSVIAAPRDSIANWILTRITQVCVLLVLFSSNTMFWSY